MHEKNNTQNTFYPPDNKCTSPPPSEKDDFRSRKNEFKTPIMLSNEISKMFSNILRGEENNISDSYRMLLIHLARQDGRTQLELANLAHIKPPTVSVTLQKMENDGYIRREPDENDLRQMRVYLTEKGREHDMRIRNKIHELEDSIVEVLSPEEFNTVVELMTKIRDNLYEKGGKCSINEQKNH